MSINSFTHLSSTAALVPERSCRALAGGAAPLWGRAIGSQICSYEVKNAVKEAAPWEILPGEMAITKVWERGACRGPALVQQAPSFSED